MSDGKNRSTPIFTAQSIIPGVEGEIRYVNDAFNIWKPLVLELISFSIKKLYKIYDYSQKNKKKTAKFLAVYCMKFTKIRIFLVA